MASFGFEDKQRNKQHILNNLIDYAIDSRGNFYNIKDIESGIFTENSYFYKGQVNDYYSLVARVNMFVGNSFSHAPERIREHYLITLEILKNKQDWEILMQTLNNGTSEP